MKYLRNVIGTGLMIFSAAAMLFSTYSVAEPRSMTEIQSSGELRACVPTANPPDGKVIPDGCTGNCGYEGIIGELVEVFAKSLDLTPSYWVSNWDGLFHNADGTTDKEASYTPRLLETGQCDMIGAVMVSLDWRLKKMDMECFIPSRMMVVTHKDRLGEFQSISDLGGRTVSVEQSMSLHTWIEDLNEDQLADNPVEITFRPFDDSIPAVDRGDVDFTVVGVLDALYHTRNLVENSAAAFAVGPLDMGCWGMRKGDTEMAVLISNFFEEQTANPDSNLNEIWSNYYGLSFFEFLRLVSKIE